MHAPEQPAPPPEPPRLERGCRLALDVGTVRIGVARSDPDGILATPHATVPRQEGADVRAIAAIVAELGARVVYVGLPRTLRGDDSASTTLARSLAEQVARAVAPVEVRLVDERLSTVDASRMMRESGRRAKEQRSVIDAAAAVVILQTALDREHASVTRAGVPLDGAQWVTRPRPGPRPSGSVTPSVPSPAAAHEQHKPRKPRHRKAPP